MSWPGPILLSVADFVACAPGKVVSKTGMPFMEIVETRRKLLHQYACVPVTASSLWEATTHAILPTGQYDRSPCTNCMQNTTILVGHCGNS